MWHTAFMHDAVTRPARYIYQSFEFDCSLVSFSIVSAISLVISTFTPLHAFSSDIPVPYKLVYEALKEALETYQINA